MKLHKDYLEEFKEMYITMNIAKSFFKINIKDDVLEELDYWREKILSSDDILEKLSCDGYASHFMLNILGKDYNYNKNKLFSAIAMVNHHLQLNTLINFIARSFTNSKNLIDKEILIMSLIRRHSANSRNIDDFGKESNIIYKEIMKDYEHYIYQRAYTVSLFKMEDFENWKFYKKEYSNKIIDSKEYTDIVSYILDQLSFNKISSLLYTDKKDNGSNIKDKINT